MQIMHDSTSPQIKHVLPDAPVAGAAALPPSNVCQGMLDGHPLPQLGPPLRRLWRSRNSCNKASSGWMLTLRPEALVVQRSRNTQPAQWPRETDHSTGSKACATPPGQRNFVAPNPTGRQFWENTGLVVPARPCRRWPGRRALLHQRTGQIGPVDVQFAQGHCCAARSASIASVTLASGALAGVTPTATIRRESRSRRTWRL